AHVPTNDGVPDNLKTTAGIIWRVLVVLAGLAVLVAIMGRIFPVVFALFFAMLVTAWTMPVMNLLKKFLPKPIAMVLALLAIGAAIVAIMAVVISSSIHEGPKLVLAIQSGFTDIEGWLKTGPLQYTDTQVANLLDQAKSAGTTVAKGVLGDALSALGLLRVESRGTLSPATPGAS
ncbi:MAG: AI-2E family transporter, partial [Actinobacteria bacterium]|nr:AI-2E family transporter [Actinomycetota bacterium]